MHPKKFILKSIATAFVGGSALISSFSSQAGVIISFPNFAGACGGALTCVGNTTDVGNVLRVTPAALGQSGAGYSPTAVQLGAGATFSTNFQFQFTNAGGIDPADGITFVLAQNATGLGVGGGGIGYQGVPNSVAIEFDTFDNGEPGGSNHVGVDRNGALDDTPSASPYGVSNCGFGGGLGCMSNGDIWSVLIGYDGINLTVSAQDGANAVQNLINTPIDIAGILGQTTAFVGFTSGTGAGFENHDILNWQLANDISLVHPVPEPVTTSLLGVGLVGLGFVGRRRARAS